jgi:hypothetical protein
MWIVKLDATPIMIYEEIMTIENKDIKRALSELLQDTGNLVSKQVDNRTLLLLVRTQVVLSLLADEVARVAKNP